MNSYPRKQFAIIVKVIHVAWAILLISSLYGCTPPGDPTEPPPVPQLIEVRKGDDTRVDPQENPIEGEIINYLQENSYFVLPSRTVKIVIKPIDFIHYQLVVRLNGESITQLEPGKDLIGDDARFTWNVIGQGNESQEVITIQPKLADRNGSGFTLKISTKPINGSTEESQPPLLIFITGADDIFHRCMSLLGTINDDPSYYTPNTRFIPLVYGNNQSGTVTKIDYLFNRFGPDNSLTMTVIDALNTNTVFDASIYFSTSEGWDKTIRALNGNTCQYNSSLELKAKKDLGEVGPILITKHDTTTLVLIKDVACGFSICEQIVAVWGEVGFWDAFGGKQIHFSWP